MKKYVFDLGPLRNLCLFYYPKRFPSLWEKFNGLKQEGLLFSVREVYNEIEKKQDDLLEWAKNNKTLFLNPTSEELFFIREIFKVPHFQSLIANKNLLNGNPAADPFLIACAKIHEAIVITTEKHKPNAAKIPNVCNHFGVGCMDLEEFMEEEGWEF